MPPESNAAAFDRVERRRAVRVRLVGLAVVLALSTTVGPVASAAAADRQKDRGDLSELWSEYPLRPSAPAVSATRQSGLTPHARQQASGVVSDPSSASFDWALPLMLAAGAGLTVTLWFGVVAVWRTGPKVASAVAASRGRRARRRQPTGGIRYREY
jgi:hypothetical protein